MPRHQLLSHRLKPATDELAAPVEAVAGYDGPAAVAVFFIGWIGVGLIQAWFLTRRGHDARTMSAIGAGLGPLMVVVTVDVLRTHEQGRQLMLEDGRLGPGDVDVLIVLHGPPGPVVAVVPTLDALGARLGRVTLAKVVAFDWIDGDENPVRAAAEADLRTAATLLSDVTPAQVVVAGHRVRAAQRFARDHDIELVLHSYDDASPAGQPPGRRLGDRRLDGPTY